MKALTLWQPWASLVALGVKTIETRCWQTKYRGLLAIHAAAQLPPRRLGAWRHTEPFRNELADVLNCRRDTVEAAVKQLPRGVVLCVVSLSQIDGTPWVRDRLCQRELMFGNYKDGRYAWLLEMVVRLNRPVAAKGNRLLWNWNWHSDQGWTWADVRRMREIEELAGAISEGFLTRHPSASLRASGGFGMTE